MIETAVPHPHHINQSQYYEIDFQTIFNLIKKNYKLIVIITAVFLIFGIYYAETRPAAYQSTALIQIKENGMLGALSFKGSASISSGASASVIQTALLHSPYVLSEVVRRLNMNISVSPKYSGFFSRKWEEHKGFPHSAQVTILNVPNILLGKQLTLVVQNNDHYTLLTKEGKKILDGTVGRSESGTYFAEPVQIKIAHIDARPGALFDVIKIPKRDVAASLANSFSIKEIGYDPNNFSSTDSGIFELSYFSGNPVTSQKILNIILSVAVAKNVQQKSEEAEKMLQFLSQQLPFAIKKLNKSEENVDQFGIQSGVFDAIAKEKDIQRTISDLHQSVQKLEFNKMILLKKFTPIHPFVVDITQKENLLNNQIIQLKKQFQTLPSLAQKEKNLKLNFKMQSEIYQNINARIQQMQMMEAGTLSSIKVLNTASYPIARVPVRKAMYMSSGAILGFIISLCIISLRYLLSPIIDDPDVVERALNISVMAILPYSEKQAVFNRSVSRSKRYSITTKPFLLARENSKDVFIEGLRSLRTSIQLSLLDATNNVIAITGCSPKVGKSFISSNLAILFSDLNKRVLVIDADIRLGKMQEVFGKTKFPGLSNYLRDNVNISEIIQNIIPAKLDFIATGLYPDNPSELLSQNKMSNLIDLLKKQYDLIIIDTPPILAVTDPALILRHSATNLIVLGIGKDQIKEVIHAKNMLEKAGVKLTGIIFNNIKAHQADRVYGKYNYHYAYNNKQ